MSKKKKQPDYKVKEESEEKEIPKGFPDIDLKRNLGCG